MPRNAEVVRQWTVLREIEASRLGATIDELASLTDVCTRTTRRDLDALQEAGFPIYDERLDGKTRWKLDQAPFKVLNETGFTLSEACALYFSRSLLEGLAGVPFRDDLSHAFKKIEAAPKPAIRRFLDKLPVVLAAKRPVGRRRDGGPQDRDHVATLLDAILRTRRVQMRYHSFASGRVKDYLIEPYQVAGRELYHCDLYRLRHPDELDDLGLLDLRAPGKVLLVEWPERAAGRLGTADLAIEITYDGPGRTLKWEARSNAGQALAIGLSGET
jgi:predicted DNA-binding transcriptional regulator YafY